MHIVLLFLFIVFQPEITFEYFDFVGGKDAFEAECGITYVPSGTKFSTIAHEKAAKVSKSLLRFIYLCWHIIKTNMCIYLCRPSQRCYNSLHRFRN